MTASELLIVSAVVLLGHDLKPAPRLLLGSVVGCWGLVFAIGDLFF